MRVLPPAFSLLALALASDAASAQTLDFSPFWPLAPGYSWKGVDATCGDVCACPSVVDWDVLVSSGQGPNAFRVGPDVNNCFVIGNSGGEFKLYGGYDAGAAWTPTGGTACLGVIPDGYAFQVEPTIWAVVRDWSRVDPNNSYGVAHSPNVAAWVWYDTSYGGGNSHNAVLESNLPPGTVLPGGSVTEVYWFVRDRGWYASLDVDALTGNPWPSAPDTLFLATLDCNGNGVFDRNDADVNGDCVPDDCTCVVVCSSSPNATGSMAELTCSGDPGTSLVVTSSPVPDTPGLFFYGPMSLLGSSFGDGLRCVGGATTRMYPFVQAGMMMQPANTAIVTVDYAAPYAAGLTGTRYFQHWFRSGLATGSGFSTSNAVSVSF